ncbi:MAG: phosphoenolpyruvate carboxykinase (ATP), partial [Bacteroidales bacterium]|nr:phosphoenolpyruvate carboxykinase (ATP) [Bacteroidales bacterium]
MSNIDLKKYGILDTTEILYNPTYEVLYNEETKPGLEGFDKGQVTELGAINVMTGIYTGRSPKDKYIVMDNFSKDTVWWNTPDYPNDNHEMSEAVWAEVKKIALKQLSGKRLFVVDGFCGTHTDTRMKVRFVMEVAWQAHFVTNMFIRPNYSRAMGHLYFDTTATERTQPFADRCSRLVEISESITLPGEYKTMEYNAHIDGVVSPAA